MTKLSIPRAGQEGSRLYKWRQEDEHSKWYRVLVEFLQSSMMTPDQTLADLKGGLKERLKREPDDSRIGWVITAYAALTDIIDKGILSISASIEQLENYLGFRLMLPSLVVH